MFQNVTNVNVQDDQENVYKDNNKLLYRIKELLKFQNIIIYVLTFLISTLSIKGEIMPFGLAMVASCVGASVPVAGVFFSSILGIAISHGIGSVGKFLVIFAIYVFLVLVFRGKVAIEERNEIMKTGGKLFGASLFVSIVSSIFHGFMMTDVFMGIISSGLLYVFYKIFVNGLACLKNVSVKSAFTIEELIAAAIIIGLASVTLNSINIGFVNLSSIIIIFVIMFLGWKNGMLLGAVSGIALGLVVSLVDGGASFVQISMYAISGILSGLLNKFGKIGVVIGFLLGNAILTYSVNGATTTVIYFKEILIASVGLLLVPQRVKLTVEDLIGKEKLIDNKGDRRLDGTTEEVSQKLKTISEMFSELMNNHEKEELEKENFIQDFLDNLEEIRNNIFYDEISNEENNIARDICIVLKQNDLITDKDLIQVLESHNNFVIMKDENIKNDLQEVVKIANRTLKVHQINNAKIIERESNTNSLNNNLKNVSKIINKCVEEIKSTKKESKYSNKEKEILVLLKSKNFKVENVSIKRLKNEKYLIEIKFDYNEVRVREKDLIINIADMLSKCLDTRIVLQRERKDDEQEDYYQVYSSEDKFVLQVGSAKMVKDGSEVSGDCSLQIKLADGKYLLAIADGMGSGEKARECSKITLRLMKQLLSAGFNKDESIALINSRINLVENSEVYSTLDALILDLFIGNAEIIKSASCDTYIKNKRNIRKIKSSSLPLGTIDKIDVQSDTVPLLDGDILIIVSDGIVDSMENDWLSEFLKNVSTNNVQKIADLILAEALDNNFGVAQDDMTVIVCKIVKKK